MPPPFLSDDPKIAQQIYDRGVYAGLLLLFWFVLFLEFKYPIVQYGVSVCISTALMALYTPLLRLGRRTVERKVSSPHIRQAVLFIATIAYELFPLWSLRATAPAWFLLCIGAIMAAYFIKEMRSTLLHVDIK